MSFVELVTAISKNTGLSKRDVRMVLKGFIEETGKTLKAGERVVLPGFGVFLSQELKARPLFGGIRTTSTKPRVRFKPSRRSS